MKVKITRKFLLIPLLFVLAVTCFFCAFTVNSAKASAELVFSEQTIKTEYNVNESFVMPKANVMVGGTQYPSTDSVIIFPDGRAYSQNECTLSQAGTYTLKYSATVNGKVVFATTTFDVLNNLFYTTGVSSTAVYSQTNKGNQAGIDVNLSLGEEFVFNKPINLNGRTREDGLLSFYTTPASIGSPDVRAVIVKLTDACNPDNYVEIHTYANPWYWEDEIGKDGVEPYPASTVTGASFNGLPLFGLNFAYAEGVGSVTNIQTIKYRDYPYFYYPYDNVGSDLDAGYNTRFFSFIGRDGYGAHPYELSMDYENRIVYGCKPNLPDSNGIVADLDDPLLFDTLWEGFETGYAILSIRADNYVTAGFSFVITDIAGENLTSTSFRDDTAPQIDVELPSGQTPKAIVGKPYELFPATAIDYVDGEVKCNAYVYFGNTESGGAFYVKDGAFTPTRAGEYYIVYEAYDRTGNLGRKYVSVTAVEASNLAISPSSTPSGLKTGVLAIVPSPTVSGAEGEYAVSVVAKHVASGDQITLTKGENGYGFMPMKSGEYVITYTVNDYSCTVTADDNFTVAINENATLKNQPVLPVAYIKGVAYELPGVIGYVFASGAPVERQATVEYAFDAGSFNAYNGGKIDMIANDRITVRYDVDGTKWEIPVPIVDVGYDGSLDMGKYFYGEGVNVTVSDGGVNMSAPASGATATFINGVLVSNLSLSLNFGALNDKGTSVILTDSVNPAQVLKLSLRKNGDYVYFSANDGKEAIVGKPLIGANVSLTYKNGASYIVLDGVTFNLNGFEGFDSHIAVMAFEFASGNAAAALNVSAINNQTLSTQSSEEVEPTFSYDVNKGNKVIGEEIVITRFTVQDVLRVYSTLKITVTDPEGNVCTTVDGVEMNKITDFSRTYRVKVQKYGYYTIRAEISDGYLGYNNRANVNFYAVDDQAPALTLTNKVTSGKVGSNVSVAKYTVEDNKVDEFDTVTVGVYVLAPTGKIIAVNESSFKPTVAGVYTVMYYATDATGNLGFESYEVKVN